MSGRSLTREERFLLKVYERVQGEEDEFIDPAPIAQELGISSKQLKTVLQLLKQINCLKQSRDSGHVALRDRGIEVCEKLKS